MVEKVNDKAYKLDLFGDYGVSSTFNVADLRPYYEDEDLLNLRSNSSQQREDDEHVPSSSKMVKANGKMDRANGAKWYGLGIRQALEEHMEALASKQGAHIWYNL